MWSRIAPASVILAFALVGLTGCHDSGPVSPTPSQAASPVTNTGPATLPTRLAVTFRLRSGAEGLPPLAGATVYIDGRSAVTDREGQLTIDDLPFHHYVDDDGDEEILSCVASPSRDTIEEILDESPLLTRELERHLRVMGGDDLPLFEDPTLITPALIEANGKRLLGLRIGGKEAAETAIVRKLDRLSLKFLDRDAAAEKRIAPRSDDELVGEMSARHPTRDVVVVEYTTSSPSRVVRRSSWWRQTEGRWRCYFHQGTPSSGSGPTAT